jgi:hypothetical protein
MGNAVMKSDILFGMAFGLQAPWHVNDILFLPSSAGWSPA